MSTLERCLVALVSALLVMILVLMIVEKDSTDFQHRTITIDDRELHCYQSWERPDTQTCDWVRYHAEVEP